MVLQNTCFFGSSFIEYNPHTIQFTHSEHTVQCFFSFFSQTCATVSFITFSLLQKENPGPLTVVPYTPPTLLPLPSCQYTFCICGFCMFICIVDISHQRSYTLSDHLHLAAFAQHCIFRVHQSCSLCQCFIPFVWITFRYMDTPCFMYLLINWWTFELFLPFANYE